MTKKELLQQLQDITVKHFDERRQEWVGTFSHSEAVEETQRLLKYFDIYKDLEDANETYAQDEARPTNNASRRYIKHGKQYFLFYPTSCGVDGQPARTGMRQRWELVRKAELKA
jgi:hypothetical protein